MYTIIVNKIIENKIWILGAFLLASAVGALNLRTLSVDAVPDITNVQVVINTKTGGLDPERIERAVTYVIETEMSGLPGLEDVRSLSKYGLSQITLVFRDGTDLYFSRQLVSQRLQNLRDLLPEGLSPELAPVTTGLGEVLMYTVEAKPGSALALQPENRRLLYLRTVQDFTIRPELKKIPGVADIDSIGGFRKEIHVNADLAAMERYGVTFNDLFDKLRTIGDSHGGGYIQNEGRQIIVRSSSPLPDLEALANIPVKLSFRGTPVRLRDVAGIREDHTLRLGAATSNGRQTVLGTALMTVGANSRQVAEDVAEAISRLNLPADVEVTPVYTRSFLVNATIHTVVKNLSEGAALVILVLVLGLGTFRSGLIVAVTIPVSMLFAVIGMRFFGVSANLMSLGAIDFGLVVDGAVVMIENLLRHLEEHPRGRDLTWPERARLVTTSAREVVKPVGLGLLIIMSVYVPLLSLQGIEGKMFHPMAITVLLALGASLLVALGLMPVLGYIFLHPPKRGPRPFDRLIGLYAGILSWTMAHRKAIVSATAAFALISFALLSRMGSDFVPTLDEGDLVLNLARAPDIGLDESIRQQEKAEKIIREFPEVKNVFSRMGTAESATDPMGVGFADTFIILKKDGRVAKSALAEAISERIERELPGHEISPTQPIAMRFNEILEGSRADVALRIFGPALDRLISAIDQARAIIENIPGVAEAEMDALTALRKSPVLNVRLDYTSLARFGVSPQDANATLRMAMGGVQIGNYYEQDHGFPVMLHLAEELREKPGEIARIPVALASGGSVPLGSIAAIENSEQVTTVARSFGKRYAALSIFLRGRDVGGFVKEAREKIESRLRLDDGYSMEWGGQFKNMERARGRLLWIIPLTLTVIFLLLLRNFNSLKQTLLVYISIPLAVTGGILSLYIRGIPLSLSAMVGFIALLGIAILNAMVLVDFINHLRASGATVRDAVLRGASTRLRPVLMTALVAGLGFVPMAVNTSLGAEVQRPLATVVIGGIISSTLLTLLLLPTLYAWLEERGPEE